MLYSDQNDEEKKSNESESIKLLSDYEDVKENSRVGLLYLYSIQFFNTKQNSLYLFHLLILSDIFHICFIFNNISYLSITGFGHASNFQSSKL
jgi:hypothetical protein